MSKLKNIVNRENIGLYRDDGLGICQNMSKTEIERLKKRIVKMFKDCGLSITTECNLKSVDFLDITFDLVNNTYKPYWKPNNEPQYINQQSNHPPNIIKQLPKLTEKCQSENSSNVDVFDESEHLVHLKQDLNKDIATILVILNTLNITILLNWQNTFSN